MRHTVAANRGQAARGIIARLAVGEELLSSLKTLARQEALPSASLTGLGAVNDITLAIYDPAARVYRETRFTEDLELATLTGNIAWLGDEPVVHAHGVVSRADCTTVAGHIMRAVASVTIEVMLQVYAERIARRPDDETGLNLLELG